MVNIQKYQIVAIGDTVAECERAYRNLMAGSGIETVDTSAVQTATGAITMLRDIVSEGDTYFYLMLEGSDDLFEGKAKEHLELMKKQVGSTVTVEYVPQQNGVNAILFVE
jgi:hypothetical protein